MYRPIYSLFRLSDWETLMHDEGHPKIQSEKELALLIADLQHERDVNKSFKDLTFYSSNPALKYIAYVDVDGIEPMMDKDTGEHVKEILSCIFFKHHYKVGIFTQCVLARAL